MSPSQQNGWLLGVQHRLCVADKVNKHLSKKMKKQKMEKMGKKDIWMMDEFFLNIWMKFFPN